MGLASNAPELDKPYFEGLVTDKPYAILETSHPEYQIVLLPYDPELEEGGGHLLIPELGSNKREHTTATWAAATDKEHYGEVVYQGVKADNYPHKIKLPPSVRRVAAWSAALAGERLRNWGHCAGNPPHEWLVTEDTTDKDN